MCIIGRECLCRQSISRKWQENKHWVSQMSFCSQLYPSSPRKRHCHYHSLKEKKGETFIPYWYLSNILRKEITLYFLNNLYKSLNVPKFHVSVLARLCVVPCRLGGVRLLMYAVRDEYIIPYVKPWSRLTGRVYHGSRIMTYRKNLGEEMDKLNHAFAVLYFYMI